VALDAGEDVPRGHAVPEVAVDPVEQFVPGDPRVGVEGDVPLLGGHIGHVRRPEVVEVVLLLDLFSEGLDVLGVGVGRLGWPVRA
jgi:hypothetical protein